MRLGLLGGTFDPVHYGHLLLAECAREQCRLDEVWLLPAAVPPHKSGCAPTAAEHRIAMLELATAGNPAFAVSRIEIDRGGVSYTISTLEELLAQDASRELFFLLGADMLADLPNWRRAAEVCQLAVPVAVRRSGHAEPDYSALAQLVPPERLELLKQHHVRMPAVEISSTEIRRRVAAGESICYQTPPAVVEYIRQHALYRRPEA